MGWDLNKLQQFCDGRSRRDFLRAGTASLFGMSLGLPEILAADRVKSPGTKDVSLIFVFLHGGLSTIDTFDLKPDAPADFRGEFNPVATNVPGIQVCEHLPHVAKVIPLARYQRPSGQYALRPATSRNNQKEEP